MPKIAAFERTAVHDSRNVLRDCMGEDGKVDMSRSHGPLLLIGGEKDEIVPADLCEKNARAYDDPARFREFEGRCHYICGQQGWEEVAAFVASWLEQRQDTRAPGATIASAPPRF